MSSDRAAARVARLLPTRFLRGYAHGKLRSDPVYTAVAERLRGHSLPLFDLGCGVGLLEFFLREHGLQTAITGVDHDASKVKVAQQIAARFERLEFRTGDVREGVAAGRSVTALDILHYFTDADQDRILESIAAAIPAGGVAIIRDAIRDETFRYKMTAAQETFSRAIRWLKAERLNFPTRGRIVLPFRRRNFEEEVVPMWGRTPFNNYLFVFRRSGEGTTHT